MKRQAHKDKALIYFQRNIRLVLAIAILLSLGLIITAGAFLPQSSSPWWCCLRVALIEIGTTVLIASTIGVFLTDAYGELRGLTIRNEVFHLVDRIRDLVDHPESFETFRLVSYMERAGLVAFYPNRNGVAQDDLQARLEQLLDEEEPVTVCVSGDTLRVLFVPGGPFTHVVHQVLSRNPNVRFRVLLLNPNCKLALYRSEAETINAPFKTDEEYRRGGFFRESMDSSETILGWNLGLTPLRGNTPIDVGYYDCADYCLAVIFPDVCYTTQYIYAEPETQVQTTGIPMMKYTADSVTYRRLLWNFNWVWDNASIAYEEVLQSLQEKPVVQMRSQGLS